MQPGEFVPPMLAITARQPFSGSDWWYETKWDGYRAMISSGRDFHIFSRRGQDLTLRYPGLAAIRHQLPDSIVLDAELVGWIDGKPGFVELQERRAERYVLVAFDCLYARGRWLLQDPLQKRREELRRQVQSSGVLVVSDGVRAQGEYLLAAAKEAGLEGVMAKKLDSPYCPGQRSANWQKFLVQYTSWVWVTDAVRAKDGSWYWTIEEVQDKVLKPVGKMRAPQGWKADRVSEPKHLGQEPFLIEVAYRGRTREGRFRHAQFRQWPTVHESRWDADSPSQSDPLSPTRN
ncbi:MAG: DNA ligase [Sulfobacillus acidophilus]|uniref:DNA ligase n=1 Tax=Sulfobacillus acidophilus TaxID=53633 RepID=A0A2T2WKS2_9FIRM|nr:MAG: DNA ligase [Sulfobacillus acidophilus]